MSNYLLLKSESGVSKIPYPGSTLPKCVTEVQTKRYTVDDQDLYGVIVKTVHFHKRYEFPHGQDKLALYEEQVRS